MSIVLAGVSDQLVCVDCFPVVASEPKGPGSVTFHVPAGSVPELHADEQEADWPEQQSWIADREDNCVQVEITVKHPADFLLISYLRWGEDQHTVRVRAREGIRVLLDGQPKRELVGYKIEEPGGPERDPSFVRRDNG